MSEYGVTPQGFVPKRLDVITKEIHKDLTKGLGVDTTLNPQSFLNVLVTGFADKIAELWELTQDVYLSQYPSFAEGQSLDNAVQYGGIRRLNEQPTYYPMHCTGIDGTIIPAGTVLSSTTNPAVQFKTYAPGVIGRSSFNRVSIKIAALQNAVYTIGINGDLYSASGGSDETAILQQLAGEINGPEYTAQVTDGLLMITDTSLQRGSTLLLSENLTTESVTSIINFGSEEIGKISLPDETITKIVKNVEGFISCTNLIPPIYGRERETDVELRQSYIRRIALRSDRMIESIESAIIDNVQGIITVKAYENDSNVWDEEGRPPHSIEVVADGGGEMEIAREILRKKAGGIQTHGNVKVEVPDLFGKTIPIRFNRPQFVYIWIRVVLTVGRNQPFPPNYGDLVKDSLITQTKALNVGDGVFPQKYIGDLYRCVTGVAYVDISTFATTDSSAAPGEYQYGNIPVSVRQKALIEGKRIEVMVQYV